MSSLLTEGIAKEEKVEDAAKSVEPQWTAMDKKPLHYWRQKEIVTMNDLAELAVDELVEV